MTATTSLKFPKQMAKLERHPGSWRVRHSKGKCQKVAQTQTSFT